MNWKLPEWVLRLLAPWGLFPDDLTQTGEVIQQKPLSGNIFQQAYEARQRCVDSSAGQTD